MGLGGNSDLNVYLGVWTNWSRGPVLGATLTLSRFDANILIALTSVFIGLVGTRIWRIICLIIHRQYSKMDKKGQDGLYHQRQIILRNSQSAQSGFLSFIRLYYAWRGVLSHALIRTLPVAFCAALIFCGFVVAGAFSTSISTGVGREALVDGSHCGIVVGENDASSQWDFLIPMEYEKAANAMNYAQQCYSSNGSGVFDCTTFVTPTLATTINDKADCPFHNENGICKNASSNLLIESTFNSRDVGLNVPDDQQVEVKTRLHCAPLETKGYTSTVNFSGANYTRYHYGSSQVGPSDNLTTANFTFHVESLETQYTMKDVPHYLVNQFIIKQVAANLINGSYELGSLFDPIPDLKTFTGDIFLAFLSGNGVIFIEPTSDPWYMATTPGGDAWNFDTTGTKMVYFKDEAATPLGCVNQYQFCRGTSKDPTDARCGPLSSYPDAIVGAAPLFGLDIDFDTLNYVDLSNSTSKAGSTFHWVHVIIYSMSFDPRRLLMTLGQKGLLSQQKFLAGMQGSLPSNQWQIDMTNLWNTSLAALQNGFVKVANGTGRPELQSSVMSPTNSYQQQLCFNQKILSSKVGSFSMFGLCFTYVMGFLIIAISFAIEPLVERRLNNRKRKVENSSGDAEAERLLESYHRHLEWVTNETLQQNRLAHEALGWGSGTWKNCTSYVPITSKREMLGSLNVLNPEHPVLHPPNPNSSIDEEETSGEREGFLVGDRDNQDERR